MKNIDVNYPLVSILINNYNYATYLGQAIDSALSQNYPNTEVIVVDDGSTDNSRDIIESYGDKIIKIFKKNGGQASALNTGFAASTGEIISLLDADDIFLPDKLTEVVNLFKSHPNNDWVFHESAAIKTKEIDNTESKVLFQKVLSKSPETLPRQIDFRANILNAELPNFTPSTSNLCFSKSLLEKIFPLPEVKGSSGVAINDYYIKYLAVGLGTGCASKKNLGIYRLHGSNIYATAEKSKRIKFYSEQYISTAYYIKIKFPSFTKLSKKLFSRGLAIYLKLKSDDNSYEQTIKEYLSNTHSLEKLEIGFQTIYYWVKLRFVDLI